MTFLESAKKVYPDVALLLNKIQLLALDKDPNEPFTDQVWPAGVMVLIAIWAGIGSCGEV